MIVTQDVIHALENMIREESTNDEINAWLIENEALLVTWSQSFSKVMIDSWDTGLAQIPQSIYQSIAGMLTKALNMGFIVGIVANNAQYDEEIDLSRVRNTALQHPALYKNWMNGELDPKYYALETVGIDTEKLGDDWNTAKSNFEKRKADASKVKEKVNLLNLLGEDNPEPIEDISI